MQKTDAQKTEVQERRNALARRLKLWKTAQAVYMSQVPGYLAAKQGPSTSDDPYEPEETKPELWPLLLPSQLSYDDRLLCHRGLTEVEHALRLAQVQDSLVDLRRLRRTLRNLRMYFKSNVVGEGQKAQTRSRAVEAGVHVRINRVVRRYRMAHAALLSLDPRGDWSKGYLELTDKDNRGPGKDIDGPGVGDGRYELSWIWKGFAGGGTQDCFDPEVNETVRHEWMTCRARADRWKEESELLQEEMRRIVAFLEWKSTWWGERVGSRLGLVAADIQHGIDSYARRQANTYHELAVSLARHWLPHLLTMGLTTSWAKPYSWAAEIFSPAARDPPGSSSVCEDPSPSAPSPEKVASPSQEQVVVKWVDTDDGSEDESNSGIDLDFDDEDGIYNEAESSDGLGTGFQYDNEGESSDGFV